MSADPIRSFAAAGLDRPGAMTRLAEDLAGQRPALFLDYDGTLVGIAPRPEQAVLDPGMRARLARLAALCPVAIVSGRDLEDVRAMVGVPGLIYAGSHGFDILAPTGPHRMGEEFRPALLRAETALRAALTGIPGVLIEPKRYALAVHVREVAEDRRESVMTTVGAVAKGEPDLRVSGGKLLWELRPDLPWDKGRAVLHLIDSEGLASRYPVYIGDDITDEDAFAALATLRGLGRRGLGLLVGDHGQATVATARLADIDAVARLLDALAAALDRIA